MTIVSFREDPAVVKRILVHLNLWGVPEPSPPSTNSSRELIYDWDFFRGLINLHALAAVTAALRFAAESAA
jgi:hypothetical protein